MTIFNSESVVLTLQTDFIWKKKKRRGLLFWSSAVPRRSLHMKWWLMNQTSYAPHLLQASQVKSCSNEAKRPLAEVALWQQASSVATWVD